MTAALVTEVALTCFFVLVILGATERRASAGFAPIPIGPARSTGPAIFVGGWAVEQLWLFWLAPLIGAALGGVVYPLIAGEKK